MLLDHCVQVGQAARAPTRSGVARVEHKSESGAPALRAVHLHPACQPACELELL